MENSDLAGDLLDGVPAISAFTGWPQRRVYYLAERGLIPLFKLDEKGKWQALKSTLRRHISNTENTNSAASIAKAKRVAHV